ncbi:MAG: hypothetical protein J6S94_03745 [Bacteroidaceae bacterium]|nr:hypothetical protein [Bacteroidaceae bacterium]
MMVRAHHHPSLPRLAEEILMTKPSWIFYDIEKGLEQKKVVSVTFDTTS